MESVGSLSTFFPLKLGLLVFWSLWYVIAFSTNSCKTFQALGVLPQNVCIRFQQPTGGHNALHDFFWLTSLHVALELCGSSGHPAQTKIAKCFSEQYVIR